jgi:hypothetical protein
MMKSKSEGAVEGVVGDIGSLAACAAIGVCEA